MKRNNYHTERERQGLRRKAAWLFMFFAGGGLILGRNGKLNEKTASILRQEIEGLKEQLKLMDSQNDTLQAAAEQFRTKAKITEEKSDEEKRKCSSFLATRNEIEDSLRAEFQKILDANMERFLSLEAEKNNTSAKYAEANLILDEETKRSESLQAEKAALEEGLRKRQLEYDLILQEKNDIEEKLQHALVEIDSVRSEKTTFENNLQETLKLESVITESSEAMEQDDSATKVTESNEKMEQLLELDKQDDKELSKSTGMYEKLQKVLLAASSQLLALEDSPDQTVDERLSSESATSFGLLKEAKEYGEEFIQSSWSKAYDIYIKVGKDLKDTNSSYPCENTIDYDDVFAKASAQYQKAHVSSVEWLDTFATSFHDGFDASSSNWLYTSSLFVKAHCEFFIRCIELMLALLCIDFAVSSIVMWWSGQKVNQKKAVKEKKAVKVINYDNVPSGSLLRKTKHGIGTAKVGTQQ